MGSCELKPNNKFSEPFQTCLESLSQANLGTVRNVPPSQAGCIHLDFTFRSSTLLALLLFSFLTVSIHIYIYYSRSIRSRPTKKLRCSSHAFRFLWSIFGGVCISLEQLRKLQEAAQVYGK